MSVLVGFDSIEDLANAFRTKISEGTEILFAEYVEDDYEGAAFVLLRRNGELYEVNASHCSCYGLEDQWDEESTNLPALRHRMENGSCFREMSPILGEILTRLEKGQ